MTALAAKKKVTKAKQGAPSSKRPRTGKTTARTTSRSPGKSSGPGIADDLVLKATGRTTDQWFKILDARAKVNAKHDHKDLASHLHAEHGCPEWWSQMVTVLYERARGHRVLGQRPDGFSVNGSRTMNVPMAKLYGAWSGGQLAKWYEGEPFTVSKATANRSIRMKHSDGTSVEVMFYDKTTKDGRVKSQVTIQHNKLKTQAAANKAKKFWSGTLDTLRDHLEG